MTSSAALAVPAEACRVASVRTWASTRMVTWGIAVDVQNAALLVIGELAANAVRHGRSELSVLLSLDTTVLQIEVADSGAPRSPVVPRLELDEDEHGWGLGIVETLSDDVTTTRGEAGWRTWARLRLDECPACLRPRPHVPAQRRR
ncbi:ATP-binding protein [Streptomyces sp. NPDC096132]|uniref:ATP-binding protein n=1 Tax=Streptomyces sp. NPDC096132 TaxID=3366075 RepID=UPI0038175A2A